MPAGCHDLQCTNDAFCHAHIPGSTCGPDGYCAKKSFLDVEDYGATAEYSNHCNWGDLICDAYYNGFRTGINAEIAKIRNHYSSLINELYNESWSGLCCDRENDEDCCPEANPDERCCVGPEYDWAIDCAGKENPDQYCNQILNTIGGNVEGRCGADDYCELRPYYFYGVNVYPAEIELILSPSADTDLYPEYTLYALDTSEDPICGGGSENPEWSDVSSAWLQ
jgi:hypothetical protein